MKHRRMRTMRLSQTVSPFGVGSVMDILGESLMGADISTWRFELTRRLPSRRIELALGVAELRSAPSVPSFASERTPGIYYQRFPRWLFCQNCRRMHRLLGNEETGEPPECKHCRGGMVPMRFIAVGTTRGHAMDVPWDRWAHSDWDNDDQHNCRKPHLTFTSTRGGTEGLSSLVVSCSTCGASRHLGELTATGSLARIGVHCSGGQPWQHGNVACDERLEVLQRGATNVTISETVTALDIPEPTVPKRDLRAEIRAHRNFDDVRTAPNGPRAAVLIGLIAEDLKIDEEVVRQIVSEPDEDNGAAEAKAGLLADEWDAFIQAVQNPDEPTGTHNFVVSTTGLVDGPSASSAGLLAEHIGHIVLVHRLREIRALEGFRRYDLDSDLVDVDLGAHGRARWLPAVESFGEGVFLTLPESHLTAWEEDESVQQRVRLLERRRRDSAIGSRFSEAIPRHVLLHTLAHMLIRRLAFSCGYSSASLRERVYASAAPNAQAGILVYTAAGDAEGTLGGLVRQGEPPRLARTILSALEEAAWCSNDPVCRESRGQGLGSMNLAACHACCLVSETSCEQSNVLLDRTLVVGDETTRGYFTEVLSRLRTEASTR